MILFLMWLTPALTFTMIVFAGFRDKALARYAGTDRRPWLVLFVGLIPVVNVIFYFVMLFKLFKK